jgi:holo-[acyl-carrier protein] synthase
LSALEVGTDIIEVARIEAADRRFARFRQRVYTESELRHCLRHANHAEGLAGRFAAKEAVIKCLGRRVPWRCIEVLNEPTGKPYVVLHGRASELAGRRRLSVSISHCRSYATAVAVMHEE